MRERSSKPPKRPADLNRLAASIVENVTGEGDHTEPPSKKDAAAVALGRKGGLKGGKARAAKLSPEQRQEVARRAAKQRWREDRET
jgi:hypothetical protein